MRVDHLGSEIAVNERIDVAYRNIKIVFRVAGKIVQIDLYCFLPFEITDRSSFEERLRIGDRFCGRQYGIDIVGGIVRIDCK